VERLVRIADTAEEFVEAIDAALNIDAHDAAWEARRDAFLAGMSWDITWSRMAELIEATLVSREFESGVNVLISPAPLQSATLGD
jgi:UDP-galactopyranose mutase